MGCQDRRVTYQEGDLVEYIAAPVFDIIIQPGGVGEVTRVVDGWVYAVWPRSGEHSVPLGNVRAVRRSRTATHGLTPNGARSQQCDGCDRLDRRGSGPGLASDEGAGRASGAAVPVAHGSNPGKVFRRGFRRRTRALGGRTVAAARQLPTARAHARSTPIGPSDACFSPHPSLLLIRKVSGERH